ncbi:MAG: MarR family transcriptional regulator [Lautropia sp.]
MKAEDSFGQELARVSRAWRTVLDGRLRDQGFTQARWYALLQLSRGAPGMSQRELAARVGVEGPTIARLIDALQRQGLVERRRADGDRRANALHLTPAAQPLIAEIDRTATELRHELLGAIPRASLETCIAVLRRIGDRLDGS